MQPPPAHSFKSYHISDSLTSTVEVVPVISLYYDLGFLLVVSSVLGRIEIPWEGGYASNLKIAQVKKREIL